MLLTKPIIRRPFFPVDHGWAYHLDGFSVSGINKTKAVSIYLHTPRDFLIANGAVCAVDNGWHWTALTIENFSINDVVTGEGIHISEGNQVPDLKIPILITKGIFKDLDEKTTPFCLQYINFSRLEINIVAFTNVKNPLLKLTNCNGDLIRLVGLSDLIVKTENCKIGRMELVNCKHIDFSAIKDEIEVTEMPTPGLINETMVGACAFVVRINGVDYKAQANSMELMRKL